jgi:RNA polymerase sigma factor (sigma-70 family)
MASCGLLPGSSTSDELLARGVREGDDRAFELLYERYSDPLRRYAGRLLRDPAAGEDAAQIALANAFRALRAGQAPRSVRPWLYGIARNAAWGLRARRTEVVELTPALEPQVEPSAGDTAALAAAVGRLPERQRAVFALRELRGVSNRETAELLGLRESQVEQLLFAGRARLAELLVFGEAASCEDVRAAAGSRLDAQQRRAFKRHAHHCDGCRELLGGRLKLGSRLLAPVEALRRVLELAAGASAPAKAGAAAALAIAASSPLLVPAVHSAEEPRYRPVPAAVAAAAPGTPNGAPGPTRVALPDHLVGETRLATPVPARVAGTSRVRAEPRPRRPVSSPPVAAEPSIAPQPRSPQPAAAAEPVVPQASTPDPATRSAASRPASAPTRASERPTPTTRMSEPPPGDRTTAERAPRRPVPTETTRPVVERPIATAEPTLRPEASIPVSREQTATAPVAVPSEAQTASEAEADPEPDPSRPTR